MTMKYLFVLSLLVGLAAAGDDTYTTENDDFDINTAVADVDSLKDLVGCFLDTVACTEVTSAFKKDISEAVKTACAKCTEAQKHLFHVFLNALKDKLPKEYEAFKNKYDPEGSHFVNLESAVKQF